MKKKIKIRIKEARGSGGYRIGSEDDPEGTIKKNRFKTPSEPTIPFPDEEEQLRVPTKKFDEFERGPEFQTAHVELPYAKSSSDPTIKEPFAGPEKKGWAERFQDFLKSEEVPEEEIAFEPEEEIVPVPEPTGINLPDLPPGKDLEFKWTGKDEMKYGSHPEEGELGDDESEIDTEDETDYEGSPVPGRNYFKPLQEIARRHFKKG